MCPLFAFALFGFRGLALQSMLAGSNFRIEGSAFVRKLSKLKHRHYMVELVRDLRRGREAERDRERGYYFSYIQYAESVRGSMYI